MSNFRYPRNSLRNAALAATLLAAVSFGQAVAQEPDDLQIDEAPAQSQAVKPGQVQDYKLPEDASLADSEDKIKELSKASADKLRNLVGESLGNSRENSDIDARSADKREIEELTHQLAKAKLAKELYKTIAGDEDQTKKELDTAKAERDELSIQVKALEEQLETANKALATQQTKKSAPNPVVARISGTAGNLSARLLVPGYGEMVVRSGDVLPSGQTVSVTDKGVSVNADGHSIRLAFGTSVSASAGR